MLLARSRPVGSPTPLPRLRAPPGLSALSAPGAWAKARWAPTHAELLTLSAAFLQRRRDAQRYKLNAEEQLVSGAREGGGREHCPGTPCSVLLLDLQWPLHGRATQP